MGFFSTLNYSSCNEDWRSERAALRIGPEDRVLCVTGSGDRPLHLLLDGPARVVALDANPAQTELLQLKRAALRALPYERYAGFLGLHPLGERERLLPEVAAALPESSRAFWLQRRRLVARGVLYAGRFERHCRRLAALTRCLRPRAVAQLFAFSDLEAQRRFVRERWDTAAWRRLVSLLCAPLVSRLVLRDPAFYQRVDPQLHVGRYLGQRMRDCLERVTARSSFMLSLILRGRLSEDDLPPYLAPRGVERLRARLDRIEAVSEEAIAHLERVEPGSYTRFSLSDLPSYLDERGVERLLRALVRAAAPGARFCIRQFLTRYPLPAELAPSLRLEPELEASLAQSDRSFAYAFTVGTVQRPGVRA